jgi:FkbM family methyltransferase
MKIQPTKFASNIYREEWFDRDFILSPDGDREWPEHHCKITWQVAQPFVHSFRNAVDVGCRDGEFSRYLQKRFDHTYAFDPRKFDRFSGNVDLSKVTHYTCALGDSEAIISMSGGTHRQVPGMIYQVPCFKLDSFEIRDVDFLKIDVEGFEKKVLQGAEKTIEKSSPVIVIEQNEVTLPGEDRYAAKYYLENIGYRHVATCPRGWDCVMVRD